MGEKKSDGWRDFTTKFAATFDSWHWAAFLFKHFQQPVFQVSSSLPDMKVLQWRIRWRFSRDKVSIFFRWPTLAFKPLLLAFFCCLLSHIPVLRN